MRLVSELILYLPCVCMRSKDSDKTALMLSLNIRYLLLVVAISNNIIMCCSFISFPVVRPASIGSTENLFLACFPRYDEKRHLKIEPVDLFYPRISSVCLPENVLCCNTMSVQWYYQSELYKV